MGTKTEEELALLEERFASARAQWAEIQSKLGEVDATGIVIAEETIDAIEAIQPRGAVVGATNMFGMRA